MEGGGGALNDLNGCACGCGGGLADGTQAPHVRWCWLQGAAAEARHSEVEASRARRSFSPFFLCGSPMSS